MRFLSSSLSEYRSATARKRPLLGGLAVLVILLISPLWGVPIAPFSSRAQPNANATLALDMDPSGNAYDDATNSMTVGAVDFCVAGTSNDVQHNHTAHVIVRDVEDLIGWKARGNFDGGQYIPFGTN